MRMQIYKLTTGGNGNGRSPEQSVLVEVTLSRRNLLALWQKLEMPGSARALLTSYDCPPGCSLIVRSEPDAEHYADRPPPRPMHPETERFIAETADGRPEAAPESPGAGASWPAAPKTEQTDLDAQDEEKEQ